MAHDPRIDAYLATLPGAQRDALQRLRSQIARVVPDAEETISYGMPTFKLRGRFLVSFAGWKRHCSIYPLTDTFLAEHASELEGFGRTRGSLHITPERPLPQALLNALVLARVSDLAAEEAR